MTTTGPSAPRRSAEISALRRLSRNVLIVGSVLAVLAAFGPVWVVRVGVLVAVAAAVTACAVTWRELADVRRQHAAATLAASRAHGSALREERRANASVVDALTGRVRAATAQVTSQQAHIVELTSQILGLTSSIATLRTQVSSLQAGMSSLRDDHTRAQDEIRRREADIAGLQDVIRAREAELVALSEAGGQLRSIPRRMLSDLELPQRAAEVPQRAAELPQRAAEGPRRPAQPATSSATPADELWLSDRRPQVVDLGDVTVAMPNYEGERKLA